MAFQKRLKKEYEEMTKRAPDGIVLADGTMQDEVDLWRIHITGADGTLYEGEHFTLQFKFSSKYPFDSPQVTFCGDQIPVHPHIYSNGHICLSILDKDWSPAMNVMSVCLSIQSMLSSCTKKVRPPDDTIYVRFATKNPKRTRWVFHDDKV
ncbi:ubiquitin-conjugating enzyme E2 W-like isoform X2 [Halichondria panicea]|uniref:ubiquitin-conjugating enzyme E2 W-like isoform X2 n=1 Tax=Halichondria panicea TaxID=6063 RepID=UPI00312B31A4